MEIFVKCSLLKPSGTQMIEKYEIVRNELHFIEWVQRRRETECKERLNQMRIWGKIKRKDRVNM